MGIPDILVEWAQDLAEAACDDPSRLLVMEGKLHGKPVFFLAVLVKSSSHTEKAMMMPLAVLLTPEDMPAVAGPEGSEAFVMGSGQPVGKA